MNAMLWSWLMSFVVLLALAIGLGAAMRPRRWLFGILIDARGRYSLTHFQLCVWSVVILSLIAGVFFGRWIDGVQDPLGFTIPGPVLGLLGISVGSAVTATAIKATKDVTAAARIAASGPGDPPRLGQIFLLEEGQYADQVIDISKFQNFVITIVLVVAYIALSVHALADASSAGTLTSLPTFSGTFLILVGISQGGYVVNKVTPQAGFAPGLTVATLSQEGAGIAPRNTKGLDVRTLLAANQQLTVARRASAMARANPGQSDLTNWLQAEAEVRAELAQTRARADAIGASTGSRDRLANLISAEAQPPAQAGAQNGTEAAVRS